MKKILLHYAQNGNMGDMLNVHICERLFNVKVRDTSVKLCEYVFIGSILEDFKKENKTVFKNIFPVKVWGTGFIQENRCDELFRRLDVYAVRGAKTLERLKKIKNVKIREEVLGDPGILASELIDKQKKKYDLGIIPHYVDKKYLPEIKLKDSSYSVIDVNEDPMECIKKIAQCRIIISSSLHGLIIADSFNIPNKRMILSNIPGNYKFDDYYSAFGIEEIRPLKNKFLIDNNLLELVNEDYIISEQDVNNKKQSLIKAFPYK